MATTTVEIPTRDGNTLAAYLELPDTAPTSWAVFAHCFACSAKSPAATRISRRLAQHGFGVLRFDFAGLGGSEGDFKDTTFHTNRTNLQDAISWLGKNHGQPELLIGHSLGGAAALATAGSVEGLKAVVSIAAPYEPGHVTKLFADDIQTIRDNGESDVKIGGKTVTISQDFLDDICGTPQKQRIENLPVPVLVMHSPIDELVDIHNAQGIYRAAPMPKSFIALDDADHLLTKRGHAAYAADVIATWASRYIEIPEDEDNEIDHPTDGVTAIMEDASDFATTIATSTHSFILDEPTSVPGAKDLGPNPFDMMLAGLAGCTSMTMRMYARRKGFELGDTRVNVTVDTKPGNTTFTRTITFADHLDDAQREKLLTIADKCPVHKAMEAHVEIDTIAD
ncbi:bifunctional alpha/beta hydrolase/OsmC family protein [Corynebacterium aquilae]|uniref:AB hydrolase-1 domain-containing protein n=1 Tax=Corynebacterium aquilae DSM 44791 TaxID=1431546 RepID=A0A1L7CDR3_9CORY|nr:bifunctional alpha/beta hydrolase/OsmC family protein [Corynebacterium aquilae]APT83985.1 hypothetical protein CAQU_01635 [Corynebacterium aquilae DSM 44791]